MIRWLNLFGVLNRKKPQEVIFLWLLTAILLGFVPVNDLIYNKAPPSLNSFTLILKVMLPLEATDGKLPLALGKDIGGAPIIVDLARMPHSAASEDDAKSCHKMLTI